MGRVLADAAVRPSKVLAPGRSQHDPRGLRLSQTFIDGAVAPHFARRQVTQADSGALGRMTGDGSTQPDLQVVGMRAEDQKVGHRVNPNASSAASISSRKW